MAIMMSQWEFPAHLPCFGSAMVTANPVVFTDSALIAAVEGHPILWDLNNADYKNVECRDQHWHIIGQSFGMTGEYLFVFVRS